VQEVLFTVPAEESTVVVPEAVQFQLGALPKSLHCVVSTLLAATSGGHVSATSHAPLIARQTPPGLPAVWPQAPALHVSVVHALLSLQLVTFPQVVPQLVTESVAVSQPSAAVELQSSVFAPQLVHTPLVQVWLAPQTVWPQPQSMREFVFSQTPGVASQSCVPVAQAVHAPDVHVCTAEQATPFAQVVPQFALVLTVFSQTPGVASQSSVPAAQLVQAPELQV
jgi:hypothetical protein